MDEGQVCSAAELACRLFFDNLPPRKIPVGWCCWGLVALRADESVRRLGSWCALVQWQRVSRVQRHRVSRYVGVVVRGKSFKTGLEAGKKGPLRGANWRPRKAPDPYFCRLMQRKERRLFPTKPSFGKKVENAKEREVVRQRSEGRNARLTTND